MVALVTGSSGFLGSAISRRLAGAGWEVVGAGRPDCEIPSPAFNTLLANAAPDIVIHCAGPASVAASVNDPGADFAGSAGVLSAVLDEVRRLPGPPRLLLLSSAAVYGDPERLPISEAQALRPVSPYGYHRMFSEQLATEYQELFAVPTASMRVFSAYGEGLPRQILWDATRKGLEHGRIDLDGTGAESRDFVHSTDVAQAALCVIEGGRFEGEAYNVGVGRETTIAELAELIRSGLGLPADAVSFNGEARPGDPVNWRADVSRLAGLGFDPEVEIAQGVAAFTAWATRELAPSSAGT